AGSNTRNGWQSKSSKQLDCSSHELIVDLNVALGGREAFVPGQCHYDLWADSAVREPSDEPAPPAMAARAVDAGSTIERSEQLTKCVCAKLCAFLRQQ